MSKCEGRRYDQVCENKVKYRSYKLAHDASVRIRKTRDKEPMQVFVCRFCQSFHIGHPVGTKSPIAIKLYIDNDGVVREK